MNERLPKFILLWQGSQRHGIHVRKDNDAANPPEDIRSFPRHELIPYYLRKTELSSPYFNS
jgi:hypothetical protein